MRSCCESNPINVSTQFCDFSPFFPLALAPRVVATAKIVTSADVFSGMLHAVRQVISDTTVTAVMVGTTHFINALLQRRGLAKVCTLRLCGPATRAILPMANWPQDLKNAVRDHN